MVFEEVIEAVSKSTLPENVREMLCKRLAYYERKLEETKNNKLDRQVFVDFMKKAEREAQKNMSEQLIHAWQNDLYKESTIWANVDDLRTIDSINRPLGVCNFNDICDKIKSTINNY